MEKDCSVVLVRLRLEFVWLVLERFICESELVCESVCSWDVMMGLFDECVSLLLLLICVCSVLLCLCKLLMLSEVCL